MSTSMARLFVSLFFVAALSLRATSAQRTCTNVALTFPLTSNTTSSDEYLAADSSPSRRICRVDRAFDDSAVRSPECSEQQPSRRMQINWPTGGSRDFFFSKTDQLRGLVYVTDRARGIIYVCSTTPSTTVSLPCAVVTRGRTQPKGLELMPPDLDGLAWIETAGRGVFVLGSTVESPKEAVPQQIILGEFATIAFDMKPAYNQDGQSSSNSITLYAVANNFTVFAVRLSRKNQQISIVGSIVNIGKLRAPENDTFFAQPLSSVVSIAVYDRILYYATSGSLYRAALTPRQTEGLDSASRNFNVLSSSSPVELHSVTFDGTDRRNRPRITRLALTCQSRIDSTVPCGVNSDTKRACERNGGICLAKRNSDDTVTEACVCPVDYSMDDATNKCVRWRTPYIQLMTTKGMQRFEISGTYSQDAYGVFPTLQQTATKPTIVSDDGLFQIQEVNDFNDATLASTSVALVYQKFSKRIQRFSSEGDISILLRNEPSATYMQYEPRSQMLYWIDDARNMIVVKDPNAPNNYTRPIFWHKDLIAFFLDPQYSALVAVLLSPAFAWQNNGWVRHATLSFVRCNLGGSGCQFGSNDVAIDERNSTLLMAYDVSSHRLYVIRDKEFPSTQLSLLSVDMTNWDKFPEHVRLSVTPSLRAAVPRNGPLPLFSVFNDRVYFVVSPGPSSDPSAPRPNITLFAGAIYRRTNPSGSSSDSPTDIQGPFTLPMESTSVSQVVKLNVGYLYNGAPRELGIRLNCAAMPCGPAELCINNTCLCSPDAPDVSSCRRPIDLVEGFKSVKANYTWRSPPPTTDCAVNDINCISALRRMCDGYPVNYPSAVAQFDDEDLRSCILAGFNLKPLKKSAHFFLSPSCETTQDELCNNVTSSTCSDNAEESASLCKALRKLPGVCASDLANRQCFLTPDSLPPALRSWFFQGRTGGAPPQLSTDLPQCTVDNTRTQKFRCICSSWAMASDDLTRCIPNNPCLDTETNTDHCAPNGRCRYSEYARRDFVCDCNPGYVSPTGRADACVDPLDLVTSNQSSICYTRQDLCGQSAGTGVCVASNSPDPTAFSCKCNLGYEISLNGMDCVISRSPIVASRTPSQSVTTKPPPKSDLCTKDPTLCGQNTGTGICLLRGENILQCRCLPGYALSADQRTCVAPVPGTTRGGDIYFNVGPNGQMTPHSSFSAAFGMGFNPKVTFSKASNQQKADASLLATPMLIVNETTVVEMSSTRKFRTVVKNSPNKILGVASNRLLGIGYIMTTKNFDSQLEIGAFVLHKVPSNWSKDPKDVVFFRVPYLGDPRKQLANSFVLDASVAPNMLAYSTNEGRRLVTCSSFLSPPLEHQTIHNHFTEKPSEDQPPLFGGMDCITLSREFKPTFTGLDIVSRQRTLVWTDKAPENTGIPSVNEISIPEAFALEYSQDDPAIFERNVVKRRQAIHELWFAKSAGEQGKNIVMAYDAIENRLTWIYGFNRVETPDDQSNAAFAAIFMSYDYQTGQMTERKLFCELIVAKTTIQGRQNIFSDKAMLSISNKVAALTLPEIEQVWFFTLPTEDTRIEPYVTNFGKVQAATFPASTPPTYTPSACDTCFGVCLAGTKETVCVCPEDNNPHSSCTPLRVASDIFNVHGVHHGKHSGSNQAAVAAVVIIVVFVLIGVVAATLVFIVRACGGVSQTVDRIRSRISTRRPEDVRPLSESMDHDDLSIHENKKRGLHMPNIFQSNQAGYVSFDRNNENVSLSNN